MKVWVVSESTCDGYECERLPTALGVAYDPLTALAIVEREARTFDKPHRLDITEGNSGYGSHPARMRNEDGKWVSSRTDVGTVTHYVTYERPDGSTYESEYEWFEIETMEVEGAPD